MKQPGQQLNKNVNDNPTPPPTSIYTGSRISQRLMLSSTVLFLGSQIQKARAFLGNTDDPAKVEALDPASKTWYQFLFPNENPFNQIPNLLSQYCSMIVGSLPTNSTEFESAFSSQCTWNNEKIGPIVEIYNEAGKNLTVEMTKCLGDMAGDICQQYNDMHHPHPVPPHSPSSQSDDVSDMIRMLPLVLVVFVVSIPVACCMIACRNRQNSSSSSTLESGLLSNSYTSSSSNISFFSSPSSASTSTTTSHAPASSGTSGVSFSFTKKPT